MSKSSESDGKVLIIGDKSENSEEDVLARHKKERKEFQSKTVSLKKSSAKGDKKRKKEVAEEIAKLELELEKRQNEELLKLQEVAGIAELTQNLVLETIPTTRVSKAQKRREKKSSQSKERDESIKAQDVENVFGARNVETQKIKQILKERSLMIQEIPSDGNCLYCAIDFQWELINAKPIGLEKLRSMTSNFLLANMSDFLPFMTHPTTDDILSAEQYEEYCHLVATSSAWGGEVELRALSRVLKCPIEVIQAVGPSIVIGQEFNNAKPVVLTYHRHMYGLGEHYNSVRPYQEPKEDELLDLTPM